MFKACNGNTAHIPQRVVHTSIAVIVAAMHIAVLWYPACHRRTSQIRGAQHFVMISLFEANKTPSERPNARFDVQVQAAFDLKVVPVDISILTAADESAGTTAGVAVLRPPSTSISDDAIPPFVNTARSPSVNGFYPKTSRTQAEAGTVTLNLCVAPGGSVMGPVTIERSSGFSRLDKAAITWARRSVWVPAVLDGAPIYQCIRYAVTFPVSSETVRSG